ncbi:MAG: hypothetical protein ACOX0A_01145 [Thermoguttaceae bacterium]|jgi:nucleoside phosphorylase
MPSPFFTRYFFDWFATQTVTRAQQMVVDEVKSRVEAGDLGDYEGVLFKNAFKGGREHRRMTDVDLGVVVATKAEIVGLLDKMGSLRKTRGDSFKYYFGTWKGRKIAIVESGEGRDASRRAAEALLQAFRPARVASVGFAIPLVASLRNLTLFVPDCLVSEEGETFDLRRRALAVESEESPDAPPESNDSEDSKDSTESHSANADVDSTEHAVIASAEASTDVPNATIDSPMAEFMSRFSTGALLSLSASRPSEEQKVGMSAYDRATWGVAEVCYAARVPFLPLRVIYDLKSLKVSAEAKRVSKNNQTLARSLGAFLGAAVKKPSSVVDVYKVKENELQAADKLADALCRILAEVDVSEHTD